MNINLHIEQLVLDGVGVKPHQKNEIKVAVEAELRRHLINQGNDSTIQSNNNRRLVKGDSISIENNHKPASLGQQIGKAVHRGIVK